MATTDTGRSAADLRAAVGDIDYEVRQLIDCAVLLASSQSRSPESVAPGTETEPTVGIALFESALLHARTLHDFLESADHRDITARDFVKGRWSPPNGDARRRLKEQLPVLQRHLSHLSWERVDGRTRTGRNPEWPLTSVAEDVLDLFEAFVAAVRNQDPQAGSWFDATLIQASEALGREWPAGVPMPSAGSPLRKRRRTLNRYDSDPRP